MPDQSHAPGSLAGKLTDLRSGPLAGVVVILRNESTGAEVRTTTAKDGTYHFTGLDAGNYTIEADSPRLGCGRLEGIAVYAGREARVQAAMSFEPPAPILPTPATLEPAQKLQAAEKIAPRPAALSLRSASPALVSTSSLQPSHALLPPASTPTFTATLPSEPLRALSLPSRPTPGPVSAPALDTASVENAAVPPLPFQRLPLTGLQRQISAHEAPKSTPPAKLAERGTEFSPGSSVSPTLPPAAPSPGRAAQRPVPATTQQLAILKPTAGLRPAVAAPLQRAPDLPAEAAPGLAAAEAGTRAALLAVQPNPPRRTVMAVAEQPSTPSLRRLQLQSTPPTCRRCR